MKNEAGKRSTFKTIILTTLFFFLFIFIVIPLLLLLFDGSKTGNVALIPIEGVITGDGASYLGSETISSKDIVSFIQEAEDNAKIEAMVVEVNSPGGSAVASDEIATALKKVKKPVVAIIREVGASGGYWVASAADHIVANRMSITGSIGVISSYLEFSGLMEKYGVGYEQLTAGEYKDAGSPYRKLTEDEKKLWQGKLDKIHGFFIQEIAANRGLAEEKVRLLATGEFYLGVEALELGLVDELGDQSTVDDYLENNYGLEKIDYVTYQKEKGLLELLTGVMSQFSFRMGQGIGSLFVVKESSMMLT